MIDSVIKVNKKYYPQTLLEECKHEIKNNKMENFINDDLGSSSSDESDNLIMNLKSLLRNMRVINLLMINLKIKTVF